MDNASEEARVALALELRGHVSEAVRDPHGNFVVQRCIALLPPARLRFLVDELNADSAAQLARSKFACRIVQRLVERWPADDVARLVGSILDDFLEVACHSFGNYVIQNIMTNGTEE